MHYLFATYNNLFVLIDNVFQQIMVVKLPIKFLRIYISFFFPSYMYKFYLLQIYIFFWSHFFKTTYFLGGAILKYVLLSFIFNFLNFYLFIYSKRRRTFQSVCI